MRSVGLQVKKTEAGCRCNGAQVQRCRGAQVQRCTGAVPDPCTPAPCTLHPCTLAPVAPYWLMLGSTAQMAILYLDSAVPRRLDGWHSPTLDLPMPIVTYGERGHPLLLFPTVARFSRTSTSSGEVDQPAILAGHVRVFSIDSINRLAWMDRRSDSGTGAAAEPLRALYRGRAYVRHMCGDPAVRIVTTGAQLRCVPRRQHAVPSSRPVHGGLELSGF